MKLKWYICTLVIVLAFFGAGQHQISVPNQKIVVQFLDDLSSADTQNAVTIVKRQLKEAGANNIIVSQDEDGKLKISYFSNLDIAIIKNILSEENQLKLGFVENQQKNDSKFPSKENQNTYNFEVYEIQKESNSGWDFSGTNILELKPESNRFSNPKVYATIHNLDFQETILKVTFKVHYSIALAIDNTSYKIPEVRAGPLV